MLTKTIVERFHPKRILVFGSHARGNVRSDSDLDLFIEMEPPRRPPDRAIEISEVFWAASMADGYRGECTHRRKSAACAM
jgi:predicted nucleotidyltransferase